MKRAGRTGATALFVFEPRKIKVGGNGNIDRNSAVFSTKNCRFPEGAVPAQPELVGTKKKKRRNFNGPGDCAAGAGCGGRYKIVAWNLQ